MPEVHVPAVTLSMAEGGAVSRRRMSTVGYRLAYFVARGCVVEILNRASGVIAATPITASRLISARKCIIIFSGIRIAAIASHLVRSRARLQNLCCSRVGGTPRFTLKTKTDGKILPRSQERKVEAC